MNIIIGDIELQDWNFNTRVSWTNFPREQAEGNYRTAYIYFEVDDGDRKFYPVFCKELWWLSNYYDGRGFDDIEEAKFGVDEFLIKMSKLKAFW